MVRNFVLSQAFASNAGPGGWNDPDMLEVGNDGMSYTEQRTHFALWVYARAPLIMGCDLGTITNATLDILTNQNLLDINQDSLG